VKYLQPVAANCTGLNFAPSAFHIRM
jgi:hypothetical protein